LEQKGTPSGKKIGSYTSENNSVQSTTHSLINE